MTPTPITDAEAQAIVLAVQADLDRRRSGGASKTVLVGLADYPWVEARAALFAVLNARGT